MSDPASFLTLPEIVALVTSLKETVDHNKEQIDWLVEVLDGRLAKGASDEETLQTKLRALEAEIRDANVRGYHADRVSQMWADRIRALLTDADAAV